MRVALTGAGGFIGQALVRTLRDRNHDVTQVRRRAGPGDAGVPVDGPLLICDLAAVDAADVLARHLRGFDAVVHAAGSYRIGIAAAERPAMWAANVDATTHVLEAALTAGVSRIVHVSTGNVLGDTHGQVVDESFARNLESGFLSYYDETKYRAHELAEAAMRYGAPVLIAMPGGVYGPGDHSAAGQQLEAAARGKLRYVALGDVGLSWVHVDDVADGIAAVLERGRIGESYLLGGQPLRLRDALRVAAHASGSVPPRITLPVAPLRILAVLGGSVAGALGMPANLSEVIKAGDGVTYWIGHEKASREVGFMPRDLAAGVHDAFTAGNTAPEGVRRPLD